MAPTIAWVDDTGQPREEAKRTQVEDPTSEQTIANSSSSGCGSKSATSISPPLIVSAVEEPVIYARRRDQIKSHENGCRSAFSWHRTISKKAACIKCEFTRGNEHGLFEVQSLGTHSSRETVGDIVCADSVRIQECKGHA